jgi:DNA replication protein DnaC
MQHHALLETYLRQLRLPTFVHNYAAFAQDAARTGLSCERYLLALSEAEIAHRDTNRVERCIRQAKFPVRKRVSSVCVNACVILRRNNFDPPLS